MAMLAERRKKTRYVLQPSSKPLWATESSGVQFGMKMMEKMGWSTGKGLGANEQGIQEPVRAIYKQDSKGVGFKGDGNPFHNQDEFDALLKSLGNDNDSREGREEIAHTFQSLEEKSKNTKSRVHYKKFTRGKDISRYSKLDLASIVGTGKKEVEEEATIGEEEEFNDEPGNVNNSFGVTTIHGGSIADYFKKKASTIIPTSQKDNCSESPNLSKDSAHQYQVVGFNYDDAAEKLDSHEDLNAHIDEERHFKSDEFPISVEKSHNSENIYKNCFPSIQVGTNKFREVDSESINKNQKKIKKHCTETGDVNVSETGDLQNVGTYKFVDSSNCVASGDVVLRGNEKRSKMEKSLQDFCTNENDDSKKELGKTKLVENDFNADINVSSEKIKTKRKIKDVDLQNVGSPFMEHQEHDFVAVINVNPEKVKKRKKVKDVDLKNVEAISTEHQEHDFDADINVSSEKVKKGKKVKDVDLRNVEAISTEHQEPDFDADINVSSEKVKKRKKVKDVDLKNVEAISTENQEHYVDADLNISSEKVKKRKKVKDVDLKKVEAINTEHPEHDFDADINFSSEKVKKGKKGKDVHLKNVEAISTEHSEHVLEAEINLSSDKVKKRKKAKDIDLKNDQSSNTEHVQPDFDADVNVIQEQVEKKRNKIKVVTPKNNESDINTGLEKVKRKRNKLKDDKSPNTSIDENNFSFEAVISDEVEHKRKKKSCKKEPKLHGDVTNKLELTSVHHTLENEDNLIGIVDIVQKVKKKRKRDKDVEELIESCNGFLETSHTDNVHNNQHKNHRKRKIFTDTECSFEETYSLEAPAEEDKKKEGCKLVLDDGENRFSLLPELSEQTEESLSKRKKKKSKKTSEEPTVLNFESNETAISKKANCKNLEEKVDGIKSPNVNEMYEQKKRKKEKLEMKAQENIGSNLESNVVLQLATEQPGSKTTLSDNPFAKEIGKIGKRFPGSSLSCVKGYGSIRRSYKV